MKNIGSFKLFFKNNLIFLIIILKIYLKVVYGSWGTGKTSNLIFCNKLLHITPRSEHITMMKYYFLCALIWLQLGIEPMTQFLWQRMFKSTVVIGSALHGLSQRFHAHGWKWWTYNHTLLYHSCSSMMISLFQLWWKGFPVVVSFVIWVWLSLPL